MTTFFQILRSGLFKSHFSAAAVALFNANAQYSTSFCLFHEKDVKLMGQHYSFHTLCFTICHPKWILNTCLGSA